MSDKRLLILDDDPLIGQTIRFISESIGFECCTTDNSQAFFQQLDHWQPSHIALDLVMPDMDGVEVMVALAERSCHASIVITSGVGHRVLDAAGRSASEHGLNIAGVLPKPFSPAAFRALLKDNSDPQSGTGLGAGAGGFKVNARELTRGLAQRELVLAYQPKIECASGKLAGFEALVRWNHPQRGILMPQHFIPFAEQNGFIDDLTDLVLDKALRWFARFTRNPDMHLSVNMMAPRAPAPSLSVNLSPRNLSTLRFADRVTALCEELSLDARHLFFELTETSAMEDPVASLDQLTQLRIKGFNLSIDDFGTGFSSMLQLVRLPFSEIKVDKSFVMNAMQSEESRTIIRSIVDLGQSLGLRVTAEGVEDGETLAYLTGLGCDLAQGYYIGRPMWAEDIPGWLTGRPH